MASHLERPLRSTLMLTSAATHCPAGSRNFCTCASLSGCIAITRLSCRACGVDRQGLRGSIGHARSRMRWRNSWTHGSELDLSTPCD